MGAYFHHLHLLLMTMLPVASLLIGGCLLGAAVPAPHTSETTPVTVVVSSLVSTTSTVKLYFYNTRDGFLKSGKWAFSKSVKPGGKSEFTLPVELPKGEWAVAITQDMNNNDKIDKNFLGIPTEPYAFSNNIRPTVAAPGFDECKFVVDGPGRVVSIVLKD
ncbi:MAG: hypothetical protein JWR44_1664 [Hymenobacter sp.]|nr:hypothetical protein [Hymenobacter sp.]